jgi:hypothetical protein
MYSCWVIVVLMFKLMHETAWLELKRYCLKTALLCQLVKLVVFTRKLFYFRSYSYNFNSFTQFDIM